MPWAWLEGKYADETGLNEQYLADKTGLSEQYFENRKKAIVDAPTPKKRACAKKKPSSKTATAICRQNRSSSR